MKISHRCIGKGERTFTLAEMSANHAHDISVVELSNIKSAMETCYEVGKNNIVFMPCSSEYPAE